MLLTGNPVVHWSTTLRVLLTALVMSPVYSGGVCSMGPRFVHGI